MNDNYLWDRSGETDPEVQRLEEILGELRYQPRPLEIPAHMPIGRRRVFFPAMAIAAAIALLAIGLGLWFTLNRQQTSPHDAKNGAQNEQNDNTPPKPAPQPDDQPGQAGVNPQPKLDRGPSRNLVAGNKRTVPPRIRQAKLTPQELADKEQVLLALRLVSAKLNLAQRKAVPSLSPVRNQHRIG